MLEKLSIADWGIDRSVNNLRNEFYAVEDQISDQRWQQAGKTLIPTRISSTSARVFTGTDKAPLNGRELTAEDVVFKLSPVNGDGQWLQQTRGHKQHSRVTGIRIDLSERRVYGSPSS